VRTPLKGRKRTTNPTLSGHNGCHCFLWPSWWRLGGMAPTGEAGYPLLPLHPLVPNPDASVETEGRVR